MSAEQESVQATDNASIEEPVKQESDETKEEKKEEPPRDEEGLLLEYDVIVCGTGLVQSILASALARAGKSVLHCDGADHYGEMDAVWSFDFMKTELSEASKATPTAPEQPRTTPPNISLAPQGAQQSLKLHSTKEVISANIQVGTLVQTPYGPGVVTKLYTDNLDMKSLVVSLTEWKLADGTSPTAHFGICKKMSLQDDTLEVYLFQTEKIRSLQSLQSEQILQNARSLALDATPAFVLAAGRAVQGMLASGVAEYLEFKSLEGLHWLQDGKLHRVPCSKGDVFGTKLFKLLDKRRLMKFMQVSLDYGTSIALIEEAAKEQAVIDAPEQEVQSLNERHLNQGRSLARPQNKAVSTEDLQVLEKCMEEGMSFEEYLRENQKLSPRLISIVRYALAMETEESSTSLAAGMSSLRHHLQALGRYGTTAFLIPMYGSGELSQAFCRSAAVFGATYLLRRAPVQVLISEDNKVTGVLVGGDKSEDAPEYAPAGSKQDKPIKCKQAVISAEAMVEFKTSRKSILRRISVLNGKLIQSDNGEQRHVIVIPPNSIGNASAIHGVVLDESVQVAPSGCTVLHLTTTVDSDTEDDSILAKACQTLLQSEDTDPVNEIYHASFSHQVADSTSTSTTEGLHICHHSGQVLAADVAFEQAQRIFSKICPGTEFLGLSEELDTVVKERAAERGDDDDERYMLDSAVGMIGSEKQAKKEEGNEDGSQERSKAKEAAEVEGKELNDK
jgi:RAB protein geranylgeranyltransferase component A